MNTPTPDRPHLTLADTTTDDTAARGSRWRQIIAELPAFWADNRGLLFIRENWLFGVFTLAGLAVLGGLLALIWTILAAIATAISTGLHGTGHGAELARALDHRRAGHHLDQQPGPRLARRPHHGPARHRPRPVDRLARHHQRALPRRPGRLHVRPYRLGGDRRPERHGRVLRCSRRTGPVAAGLTVTVWLLLSLLAYAPDQVRLLPRTDLPGHRGTSHRPRVHHHRKGLKPMITFTHPDVLTAGVRDGWADPQTDPARIDWPARQSAAQMWFDVVDGRPVNPHAPTGVR